jgi:hypothetical protein
MNVATSTTSTLDRTSMFLGTAMMLAWTLGIGIVGFALLLAIAYAMVFHNSSVAIVCSFVLFAPLILTIAWGILWVAEAEKKRWSLHRDVSVPSWWETRQGHRILYQAYFL